PSHPAAPGLPCHARPGQTKPRQGMPAVLAEPRHAWTRPCLPCVAEPGVAEPCLSRPCLPNPARPCQAMPDPTLPWLPCQFPPRRDEPCLPCVAEPYLVQPCPVQF